MANNDTCSVAKPNPDHSISLAAFMSSTSRKETRSQQLYARAVSVLPGGISRNTIFRKPNPDYAQQGRGCRVFDIDGVERIDFANNMCSLIHGHAHATTIAAVTEQLHRGTAFTLATEAELNFAEHLCGRSTAFEKIRFMNSGTEAVMSGIKLARAVTGRPKIAKTEGAYHGTYDYAEVSQKAKPENWGAREQPNQVPVAAGTPRGALDDVIVFPFNDIDQTLTLLDANKSELACVILDLLPHRVGLIPATSEYVSAVRNWTRENGKLLIFDEVITFRMGYSGAAGWFDVEPDLTAMGKIIGGGFPVGALAGKDEFMVAMDPSQADLPFPHSGTFSANPITMTAGLAAMKAFDRESVERLNRLGQTARDAIKQAIQNAAATACVTGAGSMFRIHLRDEIPTEYRITYQDENEVMRIKQLVNYLYEHGFMMINTCSGALSTAMGETEIHRFANTLENGLKALNL